MNALPHVVILGGGFGGLTAAQSLARSPVRITLIDRRNHHLFQPLLYQVATAGLSPADIAAPIRSVLAEQENCSVLLGDVVRVDVERREIVLGPAEPGHDPGPPIAYDALIVATGAKTSWFGHDDWARHCVGLKSLEDALEVRRRVLVAFERAERETDAARRDALLTFVVIGGGATGVETAGALAELSRTVLAKDFRAIDPGRARVVLIEAGPRLLSAFGGDLSQRAVAQLEALGVEVLRDARVTNIDAEAVHLDRAGEGSTITSATVVWAAGVEATRLTSTLGAPLDRSGRVLVRPDCSLPSHAEVFVLGDAAHLDDERGRPLPGVSPVAMQQARFVAQILDDEVRGVREQGVGRPRFWYFDKGSMATIGRSRAIAEVRALRRSGFLAWLAWLFVHLWYLIGFRNRC
ncbi:MAG: NAD(P)/FAD-dependent oxidoreductase, partial [Polyangiales bacterium]